MNFSPLDMSKFAGVIMLKEIADLSVYKDQDFCQALQKSVLKAVKAQTKNQTLNIDNCILAGLVAPALKLAEMGYKPSYALKEFKQKLELEYPNEKPSIVIDICTAISGVEDIIRKQRAIKPNPEYFIHPHYWYAIALLAASVLCFYLGTALFLFIGVVTLLSSLAAYKLANYSLHAEEELKETGQVYRHTQDCLALRDACSKLLLQLDAIQKDQIKIMVSKHKLKNADDYVWDNSMFYLRNAYPENELSLKSVLRKPQKYLG